MLKAVIALALVSVAVPVASGCSDDAGPADCNPAHWASAPQDLGVYVETENGVFQVQHVPHDCMYLGCVETIAGKNALPFLPVNGRGVNYEGGDVYTLAQNLVTKACGIRAGSLSSSPYWYLDLPSAVCGSVAAFAVNSNNNGSVLVVTRATSAAGAPVAQFTLYQLDGTSTPVREVAMPDGTALGAAYVGYLDATSNATFIGSTQGGLVLFGVGTGTVKSYSDLVGTTVLQWAYLASEESLGLLYSNASQTLFGLASPGQTFQVVGRTALPTFTPGWATMTSLLVSSFEIAVFTNSSTVQLGGGARTAHIMNAPWSIGTDSVNML